MLYSYNIFSEPDLLGRDAFAMRFHIYVYIYIYIYMCLRFPCGDFLLE